MSLLAGGIITKRERFHHFKVQKRAAQIPDLRDDAPLIESAPNFNGLK